MNEPIIFEYTIGPEVFQEGTNLETLLDEFEYNCVMSDFSKESFLEYINNRLNSLNDHDLRSIVISHLKKLDTNNKIIKYPTVEASSPKSDHEWRTTAETAHSVLPLDGIIINKIELSNDNSAKEIPIIEAGKLLRNDHWKKRKRRSSIVNATSANYEKILAPLLRHAEKLSIIDPYFNLGEERFKDFLRICIDGLSHTKTDKHKTIIIHCGTKKLKGNVKRELGQRELDKIDDEALERWKTEILSLIPEEKKINIEIYIRWTQKNGKRFHDRYLITDQFAVDIPLGTDVSFDSQDDTSWALSDPEDRARRWREIQPHARVFGFYKRKLVVNLKYRTGLKVPTLT